MLNRAGARHQERDVPGRPARRAARGGRDRLLGRGQRLLALGIALLLLLSIAQASRTARAAEAAVGATTGTQTTTSLVGFTQRESLATIVAVNSWVDGLATKRQLQIARALLARRLSTANDDGTTAYQLAGQEYRDALDALDRAWADAPSGVLPSDQQVATAARVAPHLIEFTEQSKHLTDRYQQFADDVLAATSESVRAQNQRQLALLVLTLGAGAVLLVWLARDVRRKYRAASVLQFRATHDALTGLVNRPELFERVHSAIRQEGAPGSIALLFIDLDGFKQVNDERGHRFGDVLLGEVADRLLAAVGNDAGTTVARLGGDEFVVLRDRVESEVEAEVLAVRVLEVMAAPVVVDGDAVVVGASIGVALADPATTSPEQLLGQADLAMYEVKRSTPGTFRRFETELETL